MYSSLRAIVASVPGEQEVIMARVRVRELAEQQGLNINQLSLRARVNVGVVRRYWYNTATGQQTGKPLTLVSLIILQQLADALNEPIGSLLGDR